MKIRKARFRIPCADNSQTAQLTGSVGAGMRTKGGNGGEYPPRNADVGVRVATMDRRRSGISARDAMLTMMM